MADGLWSYALYVPGDSERRPTTTEIINCLVTQAQMMLQDPDYDVFLQQPPYMFERSEPAVDHAETAWEEIEHLAQLVPTYERNFR